MGKSKRNRVKSRAENPTGLPSIRDIERNESELGDGGNDHMSKHECAIQAVLEMLQSPNTENKVIGLQTLATVFDAPESVEDVMKHKVVKVAAPLLFDKSTVVRNAAAGALRNLSACGSYEICNLLVEQDVMTPLAALLQEYAAGWQPSENKLEEDKVDEVRDTFIQAVHLLWNLCESNNIALRYFDGGNLLPGLVKCLEEVAAFGLDTAIAVAHCLLVVTEDNQTSIGKLQCYSSLLQKLLDLEGSESSVVLLRILACGLILNLNYGKVLSLSPTIMTQLMCNLSTTLSVDHRKALNEFTSIVPLDEAIETQTQHEQVLKSVTAMQYLLDAQKIAVELLTNMCSGDDTDEDAMDQDSSDNSSDDPFSDSGLPQEEVISTAEKVCLSVPSEVHELIVSGQLVERIWEKTQVPAKNVCDILKNNTDGKHVFNKLSTLRCHALLCLSNLIAGLDMQDLGGPCRVYTMWHDIIKLAFEETEGGDTKLLEAATSALREALHKLAEVQCILLGDVKDSDLQVMFSTGLQCKDAQVRTNLIRCVGMLGMFFAKSTADDSQRHLKNIGRFLLEVCSRESELWVVAEAIDTIMDIFGEDETDNVAADIKLVDKLQALLPSLKQKVRLQKKSLGDHYLVVTTVSTNLGPFIRYKSNRVSLIGHVNGHDM